MSPSFTDPPLRVLCVDDNHDVADSEADLLAIFGFDVRACYDGESALREVMDFHPCVCLIDLNMPGMNGDELAVRLREQEGGPPPVLVAVSARSDEKSKKRIQDAGLNPLLIKPVDPLQLVSVLNALWKTWASKCAKN
ncbi:response regulator [Zavarzinella formosa]|uniref:response regulator n=1 Tax=Zavarzinella formosa TaxID=360055 RepID=UPI0002FD7552|nr:response regulator [Zavarzinella formosa]